MAPEKSTHSAADKQPRNKKRSRTPAVDGSAAGEAVVVLSVRPPPSPVNQQEEEKNGSDGLENHWKTFALAVEERTKLDEVVKAAKEKEDNNEKMDGVVDCNHDIRIYEDMGHVCFVCGLIVKKADSIFDYQWKKVCHICENSKHKHRVDGVHLIALSFEATHHFKRLKEKNTVTDWQTAPDRKRLIWRRNGSTSQECM